MAAKCSEPRALARKPLVDKWVPAPRQFTPPSEHGRHLWEFPPMSVERSGVKNGPHLNIPSFGTFVIQ